MNDNIPCVLSVVRVYSCPYFLRNIIRSQLEVVATVCLVDEDVTPRVSKEPTPALSDRTISKEGTPVPLAGDASEKDVVRDDATSKTDTPSAAGPPTKADLHIDIR